MISRVGRVIALLLPRNKKNYAINLKFVVLIRRIVASNLELVKNETGKEMK